MLRFANSALLHAIIANGGYGPPSPESDGLSYEDYRRIGALSFSQLAQLRHRGAFSTVSQTFSACCTACAGSSNLDISGLLQSWYHVRLRSHDPMSKPNKYLGRPSLHGTQCHSFDTKVSRYTSHDHWYFGCLYWPWILR